MVKKYPYSSDRLRLQWLVFTFVLVLFGCESKNSFKSLQKTSIEPKILHVYVAPSIVTQLDSIGPDHPQWNQTDSNNWKQGWWVEKKSGPYYDLNNYVNDTLHGIVTKKRFNQIIKEEINMGVHDGYCTELRPNNKKFFPTTGYINPFKYVWYYENGNRLWFTFPNMIRIDGDQSHFVNMKGWMLNQDLDSVYVKVPYPNGNTFQEGWIKRSPDKRSTEIGEHIFYDSLGQELIRVNYDTIRI